MDNNYSYSQLNSRLSKRQSIKIENNTYAYRAPDTTRINVDLHDNTIAQLTDDTIRLYSCGWLTVTTKDRLNKILPHPYNITQDKGQWFIYNQITRVYEGIFQDGLSLAHFISTGWQIDKSTMGQDNTALRKSILKYCKGYITALKDGKIELPSNGDCMACRGIIRADDTEHLTLHIDENYYVPSLLYNAVQAFPVSIYAQEGIRQLMDAEVTQGDCETFAWIIDSQVYSSLKRYMFKQFGLPT